jgi:AcrR family transcriptional regulator
MDEDAWLDAAFHVLSKHGVEAVRIESLAKSLNVTKGSFYWHFKDRSALLDALLVTWRQRATLRVIERLERSNPQPIDRIRHLLALPRTGSASTRGGADIEAAIRLWGRSDDKAASAVIEIDRLRLRYIDSLLESTVDKKQRAAIAMLIYAFMLAEASVGPALDPGICAACEAILLRWAIPTVGTIRT